MGAHSEMKLTAGGYRILRSELGGLRQPQVDGLEFIVNSMHQDASLSYAQASYILATVWHETAHTMQPIAEYGKGRNYVYGKWFVNSKNEKYSYTSGSKNSVYLERDFPFLYYGRGYVQLTWWHNYDFAGKQLGIDFIRNPDLVMRPECAVKILIEGMKKGWFTGRKLSDYIYQSRKDYVGARRIINGTDKASLIARYAGIFERALRSL